MPDRCRHLAVAVGICGRDQPVGFALAGDRGGGSQLGRVDAGHSISGLVLQAGVPRLVALVDLDLAAEILGADEAPFTGSEEQHKQYKRAAHPTTSPQMRTGVVSLRISASTRPH